jgi:hypothetical protein
MDFLEKDLEDILYNSSQEEIKKRGLRYFEHHFIQRQFVLGNYGITDLVTIVFVPNRPFIITIYELKNKIVNSNSWWQIIRYIRGIEHFLEASGISSRKYCIRGVLIGRAVELSGEVGYIPYIESNISIYTYDYRLDGIYFERHLGTYLKSPGTLNLSSISGVTVKTPRELLRFLVSAKNFFKEANLNEKSP